MKCIAALLVLAGFALAPAQARAPDINFGTPVLQGR
ncbi:conserved exported hypothetical protein [Agrobacterium salinitolerans str. Hayward 0363]|jgi:hypothetical protein|nr:conserved exported hypothetical protein [Agrobacterium salinitolerans str. Hayward 0363]